MRLAPALSLALGLGAALAMALAPLTPASAQRSAPRDAGDAPVRLLAKGYDGEFKFYSVRCASDARGDVRVVLATDEICAVPPGGKARCRKAWTLHEAARHVCSGR